MQMTSLVDRDILKKYPGNLPYLFPSMSAYVYKERSEKYYRNVSLHNIEKVAAMSNMLVIPANCLHWQRKKKFGDRNIRLIGKSYYILHPDELTDLEYAKYLAVCNTE